MCTRRCPVSPACCPILDDYWRDQVTTRGMVDLVSQSYPQHSPITAREDWRPETGKPGSRLVDMQRHVIDPFQLSSAICNPLYGVQMVFSEDMQDAFCRALNDWLVKEWLDRDPRLRGSIVIPTQSVEKAVAEIERCAADKRFVQVLMLRDGRHPARQAGAVADLQGRPNGWIWRWASMPVPPITIRRPRWAGALPHRGLCRAGAGVPDPADQLDRRGRVRLVSPAEDGDAESGVSGSAPYAWRLHKVLARRADGNALGQSRPAGNCAQQHPFLFTAI